jgi:uncharacterized SAM-binding protein YcdF (DUF218 family)
MHDFLKNLILPPASLLIAALLAHVLWQKSRIGRGLVTASLVLLYLLSTPMVSQSLLAMLEIYPALPVDGPLPQGPEAIVILGADLRDTPEYAALSPGPFTMERLRYGAQLQRRSALPVLVTGKIASAPSRSIGAVMRQSLTDDFQVPVEWVDELAETTRENAQRSATILHAAGVTRIFLVTHAWHMRRAKLAFEKVGLTVVPAPTAFATGKHPFGIDFSVWAAMPSSKAMQGSYFALHEALGLAYYRLLFMQ